MKIKVAAVQPEAVYGAEEYKNAEQCLSYLEEAARTWAQPIYLPEDYPNHAHGPLAMDEGKILSTKCKRHSAYEYPTFYCRNICSASDMEWAEISGDTEFLARYAING